MRHLDSEKHLVVTTYVSNVAKGPTLKQNVGQGLQPVAFESRKLNDVETRYSAYECKLLGFVWASGQWLHYFQGSHSVIIGTDHSPKAPANS